MKPVDRLRIRSIVHNWRESPTIPPTYIRVRAVVWECGEGQTDTETAVTTIHFASATPHTKRKHHKLDTESRNDQCRSELRSRREIAVSHRRTAATATLAGFSPTSEFQRAWQRMSRAADEFTRLPHQFSLGCSPTTRDALPSSATAGRHSLQCQRNVT